jgi:chemotaxis protein MotB
MSAGGADHKAEIVVIRRNHGGHDDGHHGGAWKIAYADFVTAMMAFFLVMWLINASNEATRAQVASYFNPVKLTDSSTSKRGLEDPKETFKQKQDHAEEKAVPEVKSEVAAELKAAEDTMMQHPMEALDQIAGAAERQATEPAPKAATEMLHDPFDPQAWQAVPPAAESPAPQPSEKTPAPPILKEEPPPAQPPEKKEAVPPAPDETPPQTAVEKQPATPEQPAEKRTEGPQVQASPPVAPSTPPQPSIAQEQEAEQIKTEILARYGAGDKALPANLEVKATHEGVLISLTDRHLFGMFAVGSAEPQPKLVELAAAIASALKDRRGDVVIRGHTDARPYRNKKYDNWQLSTARAHMAYYMLLRGGLAEQRVLRVEGYADRDPINAADPEADENRRIDILLSGVAP